MADDAETDLKDDANLPAAVLPLLAAGRAKRAEEERQRALAERGRADAKAAILAANRAVAAVELVCLCPDIGPLMQYATIDDRDDHLRTGAEFLGVEFRFAIPGFADIFVWVCRKANRVAHPEVPVATEFGPWYHDSFKVVTHCSRAQYAELSYALALAREEFFRADVPL